MKPILFTGLFLFLFAFCSIAQKYDEGVFEFGLLELEPPNDFTDTSGLVTIRNMMEQELSMTVYFNKDRVAVTKIGLLGDTTRRVYDLGSNMMYQFKEMLNQPGFLIEAFPPIANAQKDSILINRVDYDEGIPFKNELFEGIDAVEVVIDDHPNIITLWLTKDFIFKDVMQVNPFHTDEYSILRVSMSDVLRGGVITTGFKSFSPIIPNQQIFSIDTTSSFNHTQLRSDLQEGFTELAEEEKQLQEKFGDFESVGINQALISAFIENGALDKDNWELSEAIENNTSYDIPSILLLAIDEDTGLPAMDRDSIRALFEAHRILTPTVEQLLNLGESEWSKIPEHLTYQAICIAAIKDHLNSKKTKEQIVKNLQLMEFTTYAPLEESYIKEEHIPLLDDLLATTSIFYKLYKGFVTNNDDLKQFVRNFFYDSVLQSEIDTSLFDESFEGSIYSFSDGTNAYSYDINELRNVDYEKSDFENIPPLVKYRDTVTLDVAFYNKLMDMIRQVGTDYNTELAYHIYEFKPPFTPLIDEDDYLSIVENCFILDMDIDVLFFQCFPKSDYDFFSGDVGTSFDYHPESTDKQLSIGNFRIGNVDAGIDYITSTQKNEFITFLTQNHSVFNIRKEDLESVTEDVKKSLLAGAEALLRYLPDTKIVVSKLFDSPKGEYIPSFNEERDDFKHAYPSLYKVIKDDFVATGFRYNREEHKVYFTCNGKEYNIDPEERHMLKFIIDYMKESKSGKRLYPVLMFSLSEEHYYYLKPSHKKELGKIVPLDF